MSQTKIRKEQIENAFVGKTGDETIAGIKTFSSFSVTPSSAPTTDYQVANKKYVDDNSGGSGGISDIVEDTTPQLGGNLDTNAFDIQFDNGKGIRDDSDNEQLIFGKTESATTYAKLTNNTDGNGLKLEVAGGGTNEDFIINSKGTGALSVAGTTDYENNVTDDDDIPNKKYIDDKKLDDFATPDDNTDLNATTSHHGLLPKLGGGTTNFLRADGTWAEPSGGGGGSSNFILTQPHDITSGFSAFAIKLTGDSSNFYTPSSGKVGYIMYVWQRTSALSLDINNIRMANEYGFGFLPSSDYTGHLTIPLVLKDTDVLDSSGGTSTNYTEVAGFECDENINITPITTDGAYTVPTGKKYVMLTAYTEGLTRNITINGTQIEIAAGLNHGDIDCGPFSIHLPIVLEAGDTVDGTFKHSGYLIPDDFSI